MYGLLNVDGCIVIGKGRGWRLGGGVKHERSRQEQGGVRRDSICCCCCESITDNLLIVMRI